MGSTGSLSAGVPRTLGQHLAKRFVEIGIDSFFGVPGDYNLGLLDELAKEERLKAVWCCNELNAGYAADGFARVRGAGAVVVTFTVGGLSVINAVAGAYAENLPLICVVGGPNSNDFASNRRLHHTIGSKLDYMQEMRAFKQVTCEQVVIQDLDDAHELIDKAISAALVNSKPVYICVCCNLSTLHHPTFAKPPIPYSLNIKASNPTGLEAAIDAAVAFLANKAKPVLVAGGLMRRCKAAKGFMSLVDASGMPYAVMPAGKGMIPETHAHYIGYYWGQISTPFCGEVVESADAYLFAGPIFSDYSTAGYSLNLMPGKMVLVEPERVTVGGGEGGQVFGCVRMADFLAGLAKRICPNSTALDIYRRMASPPGEVPPSEDGSPLVAKSLFKHIQARLLTPQSVVVAETGDSWFNCQKLRLPEGATYEWMMQYGSIGWSVGATLGAAVAGARLGRRVLACIGDGSFQMTAQEVSTMMRYGQNPIIMLINNGGYTIEVEIHDGPYNIIKNWDYVAFVKALQNGEGELFTTRVRTEAELLEALDHVNAPENAKALCFIEVVLHKDDCSRELLEFGALVSSANGRAPQQH